MAYHKGIPIPPPPFFSSLSFFFPEIMKSRFTFKCLYAFPWILASLVHRVSCYWYIDFCFVCFCFVASTAIDIVSHKGICYVVHQLDVVVIRIRGTTMGPFIICSSPYFFYLFFDILVINPLCTSLILINTIQYNTISWSGASADLDTIR